MGIHDTSKSKDEKAAANILATLQDNKPVSKAKMENGLTTATLQQLLVRSNTMRTQSTTSSVTFHKSPKDNLKQLIRSGSRINSGNIKMDDNVSEHSSMIGQHTNVALVAKNVHKGFVEPWTVKDFSRATYHYKLIVLCHCFMDVKLSTDHVLFGSNGCISYTLGQYVQSLQFRNVPAPMADDDEGSEADFVWIRQCRVHSLFSTEDAAKYLCSDKILEFHIFFASKKLPLSELNHLDLQWEGTFHLDISKLNWAEATSEGLEKIEAIIPVNTVTMGALLVKISLAIAKCDNLPVELGTLTFHKEKSCFWPPPNFHDLTPLPSAWISMMLSKHYAHAEYKKDAINSSMDQGVRDIREFITSRKHAEFVYKIFHQEGVANTGTIFKSVIIEKIVSILGKEISFGTETTRAKLGPIFQAIQDMVTDNVLPVRYVT